MKKQSRYIILVTTHYSPLVGGAATYFSALGRELSRRGLAVRVLTTRVARQATHEVIDGVHVVRVIPSLGSAPQAVRKVAQTLMTFGWLKWWWLRRQVRIIHTHASKSVTLGSAMASSLFRIPIVYDVQDFLSRPNVIRRGWRPKYVATGQPITERLLALHIPRGGILTIPSVPPESAFGALPNRAGHTATRFLFVGELHHEIKATDILLAAWNNVHDAHADARLVLIGDGPEAVIDHAYARDHDLANVTEFRGALPAAEVLRAMDEADVLVVASRTEGMPRVILEAWARGMAVIATDVGGIPEVVKNKQTGLLVPANNVMELAIAMNRLIAEPELRLRLAIAGHEWVMKLPRWPEVVAKIEGFYR